MGGIELAKEERRIEPVVVERKEESSKDRKKEGFYSVRCLLFLFWFESANCFSTISTPISGSTCITWLLVFPTSFLLRTTPSFDSSLGPHAPVGSKLVHNLGSSSFM